MPANPLEYNKKGPHSFEWGLLVAEEDLNLRRPSCGARLIARLCVALAGRCAKFFSLHPPLAAVEEFAPG